jgi:rRNA maturation protein Nop10
MTTIRTPCPGCGDDHEVDLAPEQILLLVGEESEGSYVFVCPECGELQDKPAPPKIAAVLEEAGVPRGTTGP